MAEDVDWGYQRGLARVEAAVDEVLAEFAVSYVGRAVHRGETLPPRPLPGVAWSIDGDLVVEFVYRESERDSILVHDIALLEVLKKRLRTRHVEVAYAETTWE